MLLTLLLTLSSVGCAEPPTAAVEAAKGRLSAVATEAMIYAPDEFGTAEDTVAELDTELETQAGRFALVRAYERTSELVTSVETAVDAVESAVGTEKQRLRSETNQLVTDAERAVTTAHDSIGAIPSEDLPEEQASAWDTELAGVETSLAETGRLLGVDQLIDARREADVALTAVSEVNTAVSALVAELERVREEEVARRVRGEITIPVAVMADGQRLAAGNYVLRLAEDGRATSGTVSPGRWVEFVDGETVAGRGLAIVIPDTEIGEVSDSGSPQNEARVAVLKEGEYVRVWLNRDGVNYLVHMPRA